MAIEVNDIWFGYGAGEDVLRGVSLEVGPGEVVALLGRNGSGKSTLVRHFNGLLLPEKGKVKINGVCTSGHSVAGLASMVGLLFQNPDDQICKGTVWAEVAFGPRNLGFPEERVQEHVDGLLSYFGLADEAGRNPYDLGDSSRKMLAIASVLAMDTGIVVFDEPTAGLDSGETALLAGAVQGLAAEDRSVIIISHDMDFVAEQASRCICLESGRKSFDGSTGELFSSSEILERCGLIPPQMIRLAEYYGIKLSEISPQGFIDKMYF